MIPETAAGTTTRMLVARRRAPRPYEASRKRVRNRVHRILGHGGDERRDEQSHARCPRTGG